MKSYKLNIGIFFKYNQQTLNKKQKLWLKQNNLNFNKTNSK